MHKSIVYIDVSGNGWVLPYTLSLHDSKGQFLGVAGVEMTLEYIKHYYQWFGHF